SLPSPRRGYAAARIPQSTFFGSFELGSLEVAERAEMLGDVRLVLAGPPATGNQGGRVRRGRGSHRVRREELRTQHALHHGLVVALGHRHVEQVQHGRRYRLDRIRTMLAQCGSGGTREEVDAGRVVRPRVAELLVRTEELRRAQLAPQ